MELQQQKANLKKLAFFIFAVSSLTLWVCYYKQTSLTYEPVSFIKSNERNRNSTDTELEFLVWSSKCKIPNLDPFNSEAKRFYRPEKYTPCTDRKLLTYITNEDNIPVLHVNTSVAASYKAREVVCCYSNITRSGSKDDPDSSFSTSTCQYFTNNVTLNHSMIQVNCYKSKHKKSMVYSNVHAVITFNEKIRAKINKSSPNILSVLFVGIDSISRLNMIRTLPKSYQFVKENNWIELTGYNKVADNTFPNLMAIFTGLNETQAYKICKPKQVGYLDKCNFLWYDFSRFNYVTAYAEDDAAINTFNYNKKGFVDEPTDFYFRPYVLASEKLKITKKDGMIYCTGPETAGERILNIAKYFAGTLKNSSHFGVFWMNSFSHNEINSPSGMDGKIYKFLRYLTDEGVLENSMVVFLSDHGLRFGKIRYTRSGWLEERLPYIFISVPKWFKENFPRAFANLQDSQDKLVTPYDLHMTLQDVLVFSGKKHEVKQSAACPKCKSLFRKIDENRSCKDAGINQHWCTCTDYNPINTKNTTVLRAARFILQKLEEVKATRGSESKRCAKMILKRVISSSISDSISGLYQNNTYLLIVLETSPLAVFEGTVEALSNNGSTAFSLLGGISRLDYYNPHSKCVSDSYLKQLCYCHR